MTDKLREAARAGWVAAIRLSHNIAVQEANRHNDNDEDCNTETVFRIKDRIRDWEQPTDEQLSEMVAEAGGAAALTEADAVRVKGGQGSHWEGCYKTHADCADALIDELRAEVGRLREVIIELIDEAEEAIGIVDGKYVAQYDECGDERCGRCYTDDTAEAGHRCDDTPATCPTCGSDTKSMLNTACWIDSVSPDPWHDTPPPAAPAKCPTCACQGGLVGAGVVHGPVSCAHPPVPVRDGGQFGPAETICGGCGGDGTHQHPYNARCRDIAGHDVDPRYVTMLMPEGRRVNTEPPSPGGPASCRDATDSERQDSGAPSQHATTGPRLQPDHAAVLLRLADGTESFYGPVPIAAFRAGAAAIEERDRLRETNTRLNRRLTKAEGAIVEKIDECRRKGLSLGRALSASAYAMKEAECDRLRGELSAAVHLSDVRLADLDALRARYDRLREDAVDCASHLMTWTSADVLSARRILALDGKE